MSFFPLSLYLTLCVNLSDALAAPSQISSESKSKKCEVLSQNQEIKNIETGLRTVRLTLEGQSEEKCEDKNPAPTPISQASVNKHNIQEFVIEAKALKKGESF